MATDEETQRVAVRTYVPSYQKEEWKEHADEMGMSQAEFVRTMVQAGRREFDIGGLSESGTSNPSEGGQRDATPGVNGLEDRVVEILKSEGYCDWEELVAGLTDDIEDRLDETLARLQQENTVQYSGRHGGYTVVGDGR